MPTICPNCLRPLRTNAKFCGYCGTSLLPTTRADAMTLQASPQEVDNKDNTSAPAQSKPKSKKNIRRIVLIVLIILLCLVLLVAFLVHYWPNIFPNFGSLISLILRFKNH